MDYVLRGLIKAGGYTDEDLGKPIVEIVNSWSEWNPGHQHLRMVADAVKRGVWSAGGFPLECNTFSLCPGETLSNRNMLAMEIEAIVARGYGAEPADAVVFICSCDKETPAMLMAATRIDLPSIFVLGGAMLPGRWKDEDVVGGTDPQRMWDAVRSGEMTKEDWESFVDCLCPTCGACQPMGTANTMQSITEALGMALPGCATTPAVSAELYQRAEMAGRAIMKLLEKGIVTRRIITEASIDNAIKVLMAIGGSTNAVIHLIALAHQLDVDLSLERFDQISRETPWITNVKPCGKYAVVDLHKVGGIKAVMKNLEPLLDNNVMTVTGQTLKENLAGFKVSQNDMVYTIKDPILDEGGLAVLRGNLAPNGAIIKHASSRDRNLLQHKGPAKVFDTLREAQEQLAREDLDVTEDHVLVLRNMGPKGAMMPEEGALPIPVPLAKRGIRDIVRITDCRISGTRFGTIVVHISPEAYVGGPLAAVGDGDIIEIDLKQRRLNVHLSDREIQRRLAKWTPPEVCYEYKKGSLALWYRDCEQADKGCVYPYM